MADDTTAQPAAPDDQTQALIQQMLRQTLSPQSYQPPEPPHSGDNRTWGSLLGQALVGGGGPGSTDAQNERAGLQALSNIGLGMMSGSDYSQQRHTLGSIVAGAIGGAQESNAAQNAAQLEYQKTQQEMQLNRIKEAVPLLTLQQNLARLKAATGMPNPLASTPTSIGAAGTGGIGAVGGNTYESAIGGHEGLGADSRLPSTVGGFIPSTWQGFVAANPDLFKGMTAEQQMAARSDPKLNAAGITWLAQQNADALTKAGVTPSGTSLGIAHYLGAGAAAKALQASDDTPVRNFVSADAIKYNPELGTMTVGQLKQRYAAVPAPSFLAPATAAKPPGAPPGTTAVAAPPAGAPGVAQGDVAHPELAPGPPGSTGGAPIGIGAALPPPATAKGTPIPTGKLLKSEAAPGEADANVMMAAVQARQAAAGAPGVLTAGPGAGPSLPPSPAAAPAATPQPGWGTGAATGYNMGSTGAAAPPSPPAAVVTAQTPPAPAPAPSPAAAKADAELTWPEYQDRYGRQPTADESSRFQITPDPMALADAEKAKATASQQLQLARGGVGDADKALAQYNVANDAVNRLRQEAQIQTANNQKDWFAKRDEILATNYRAARQEAAATALKTQEGNQAIDLEKVKAGQTWHQKLQEQAATYAQDNTIKPMAASAAKAHQMNLGLSQMIPILQDLPPSGGPLGSVLEAHPDLAPLLKTAGVLDDKQADAVRLINGLVSNISTEMKPQGLGALREYEWDAFKSQLPGMLTTKDGQLKAVALLMNMNNRIQQEHSWMSSYFSRKIPDEANANKTVPAHNLESDDPKESVQMRMDRELGPIIPSAPAGGSQAQWEQSLRPGQPYYKSWAMPDPQNRGQPLRDAQGNIRTTKTLEVRPWQ